MEIRWWVPNVIISILLKKGWFSYVRVSLKRDEFHIYMTQLSLQSIKRYFLEDKKASDLSNQAFEALKSLTRQLFLCISNPAVNSHFLAGIRPHKSTCLTNWSPSLLEILISRPKKYFDFLCLLVTAMSKMRSMEPRIFLHPKISNL